MEETGAPARRQRVPWQVKFGSLAVIWGASFLFMKVGLRWFSPVQIATGGQVGFEPWQLLTYSFLHGGFVHLLFNMFALYMFGGALEEVVGPRRYTAYYLVSVLAAAITQLIVMGLAALLVFHIFVNLGMVVGLMPIMGIPLPLLSYGGSSLLMMFMGFGLALSVRLRRFVN